MRPSFVDRVRALFLEKGIPLETEGDPFRPALEEAFDREVSIARSRHEAESEVLRMHEKATQAQERLQEARTDLESANQTLDERIQDLDFGPLAEPGRTEAHDPSSVRYETRSETQSIEVEPDRFGP